MKKTTIKAKALNFYLSYYNLKKLDDEHEKFFKNFYRDYKKIRKMLERKEPCLWLICTSYRRTNYNNRSTRRVIITNYELQYIINMISWNHNNKFTTWWIGTSHALNIFDKICYKLGFEGCCDSKISQSCYIEE